MLNRIGLIFIFFYFIGNSCKDGIVSPCPIPSYNDQENLNECKEITAIKSTCSYRSDGANEKHGRDKITSCKDICQILSTTPSGEPNKLGKKRINSSKNDFLKPI